MAQTFQQKYDLLRPGVEQAFLRANRGKELTLAQLEKIHAIASEAAELTDRVLSPEETAELFQPIRRKKGSKIITEVLKKVAPSISVEVHTTSGSSQVASEVDERVARRFRRYLARRQRAIATEKTKSKKRRG